MFVAPEPVCFTESSAYLISTCLTLYGGLPQKGELQAPVIKEAARFQSKR